VAPTARGLGGRRARRGSHLAKDNVLRNDSLWGIALVAGSLAALSGALVQRTYIWVHDYCTEHPDMGLIYGSPQSLNTGELGNGMISARTFWAVYSKVGVP